MNELLACIANERSSCSTFGSAEELAWSKAVRQARHQEQDPPGWMYVSLLVVLLLLPFSLLHACACESLSPLCLLWRLQVACKRTFFEVLLLLSDRENS